MIYTEPRLRPRSRTALLVYIMMAFPQACSGVSCGMVSDARGGKAVMIHDCGITDARFETCVAGCDDQLPRVFLSASSYPDVLHTAAM